MKRVQAYIGLRGARNINEMADVPGEKMNLFNTHVFKPVHMDCRIRKTKWCVLRLPNASMAQQAGMSTEAFEDFYFDVCNLDYPRLSGPSGRWSSGWRRPEGRPHHGAGDRPPVLDRRHPGRPLRRRDEHPRRRGLHRPVRDSVEGLVRFNTPTVYQGSSFDGVRLEFRAGQDRRGGLRRGATRKKLRRILDSDEGASYIGEWSIGCNPRILHPMRDILFDEKIAGSFHLTPGNAYDEADNGNRSKVHWDLVQIQRSEYGGGTIAFDGVSRSGSTAGSSPRNSGPSTRNDPGKTGGHRRIAPGRRPAGFDRSTSPENLNA